MELVTSLLLEAEPSGCGCRFSSELNAVNSMTSQEIEAVGCSAEGLLAELLFYLVEGALTLLRNVVLGEGRMFLNSKSLDGLLSRRGVTSGHTKTDI